jgi:hypothetical protein
MSATNLSNANLGKASLCEASLNRAILDNAYLVESFLMRADLNSAHFNDAKLNEANLSGASLRGAYFNRANLRGADLSWTILDEALFIEANLSQARLANANLSRAHLDRADMSRAIVQSTIFGDIDLSLVKGLETIDHRGPSTLGIDTIYHSQGNIPEVFLRGAGVPDSFITYSRSLISHPIDYYTCFISYSSYDEAFAKRLHADLQSTGVRCWFAPEDLKIGDKIRPCIDESIRLYDKLLIVLSEHSIASQWVEQEVETALAKERKEHRTVLFPIRLGKAIMQIERGWPALIRNTRNIGDFTRWKHHDAYQQALDRLLRDLKAEAAPDEV